jgi:predicted phage terminase large subunit-like protein
MSPNNSVSRRHTELGQLLAKAELRQLIETRETCQESLAAFVRGAWNQIDTAPFLSNWATDGMAEHLEAVTSGHIKRLLINIPPRCQKTSTVSVCWPAWTWARPQRSFVDGPQVKFLCGSYNDELSLDNANMTRRLILGPWYQKLWGDKYDFRNDQNSKSNFGNTMGGQRVAASVGGTLLGLGGDIVVVDDPHNVEGAESDKDRARAERWWNELSSTRLNSQRESAIVVCMQRLHVSDISGLILDSDEDWVHFMVPMRHDERRHCVTVRLPQFTDPEPWQDPRTQEGELMWPERFDEAEVARMEKRLTIYSAAGRLQQSPSPTGGGIIKRDWWQLWDQEQAQKYGLDWNERTKEFPHFDMVVASLDTSYGEKQENDYNAMTVWGIWIDKAKNRRVMLCYAWAKRLPLHGKVVTAIHGEAKVQFEQRQQEAWGLVEWVASTCKKYRVKRLLIEDKTRGRDVANEIRRQYARENWGVHLINPVGDKVIRVHSVVPLFVDDMVWAPEMKWADLVMTECEVFPKGAHDDLVDSTSQFLNWGRESGVLVRADEMEAELQDEMEYRTPQDTVASQYGV